MSKLTYKVEYSRRGTMIRFNRRPPQKARDQLESVGFRYNAQFRTWIGKKNTDKAVAIADAAVNRGMDVQYYGTLCWECANATGSCSWSKSFKPVDGRKAKKNNIKSWLQCLLWQAEKGRIVYREEMPGICTRQTAREGDNR